MRAAKAPKTVALVGACALATLAPASAAAVIVVSDSGGGPGQLAASPHLGYVGSWNGASAVAVGPDWIISARHVGGAPGTTFSLHGQEYHAQQVIGHPTSDLLLARLDAPLPGWHALSAPALPGQDVVLGGVGFQSGAFLGDGYDWSGEPGLAWGRNRLDGVGTRMSLTFDDPKSPGAVPGEATFAMLDSGGGLFTVDDDNQLRLAGIAVAITGTFGRSLFGDRAFAVNLDPVNAWILSYVSPGEPIASSVAPPTNLVSPASPPVPAPASAAALLGLGLILAGPRRRRR